MTAATPQNDKNIAGKKPPLHQQLTFTGLEIIRALCNLAR